MAIDKNTRELVKVILKSKGKEYDDWLTELYQEVIDENTKILKDALNFKLELETISN